MTRFRTLILAAAVAGAPPLSAAVVQSIDRQYDNLGHLLKETYPNGGWQQYSYDAMGRRLTRTDHLGRVTQYSYDALNRLSTATDASQGITRYSYDGRDNLVQVTDPRGLVTQYQYSGFDDLITQTSPDTGNSSASFNAGGQLVSQTDAKGQLTQYGYDTAGRIKTVTYANQSTSTYRYTGPKLVGIDDSSGALSLNYDDYGRISIQNRKVGAFNYTISYTRDAKGRISNLRYPSGRAVRYSYNSAGQVNQIDSQLGTGPILTLISNIAYRPYGPAQSWTYGNGLQRTSSYDQDGNLTGLSLGDSTVTLSYDKAGRLTGQTISGGWWQRLLQSLGINAGQQDQYEYDSLDRLSNWQDGTTSQQYDYDANGNRLLLKRNGTAYPQFVQTANNQLVSHAGPSPETYSYDANGSRTADNRGTYLYDARGRLIQAGGASYTLNTQGQRTGKTYQGQTTLYHYDAAGHLVAETDNEGHTRKEYIYLADTPVAVIDADQSVRYIHSDHLGTPRLLTNASQKAVWAWQGEPFGADQANEDPESTGTKYSFNLRFPGQYYDVETGNHYNLNRDYDPKVGRYVQSDPIGLAGGINTYGYVEGNPLSYADPSGLSRYIAIPVGNPQYKSASKVPDLNWALTIVSHGNNNTMSSHDAEWWSNFIQNDLQKEELWRPGMPVVLHACNTGNASWASKRPLIAAELSRRLGVQVVAPEGYIFNYLWPFDGVEMKSPYDSGLFGLPGEPGSWWLFNPDGTKENLGRKFP
ncbi:RHS repeat-associated core domain-containing protein [Chitinimonas naiadis]